VLIFQIFAFVAGAYLIFLTLHSAVRTFVLPRGAQDPIARLVFVTIRRLFVLRVNRIRAYSQRDRLMAFFAPVSLLALLPVWLTVTLLGFMAVFWSLDPGSWYRAFRLSGSSLLTLGFEDTHTLLETSLSFFEGALGLLLVALLIAYLPTMYAAFSRRETAVKLLEVRAGNPPSAIEMLQRFNRIHGLDRLTEQWQIWETWFAEIEESHTSLSALVFFRSPQSNQSWVTAAGTVLDAAALSLAAVDRPNDPPAALCIRAGYLALRRVADFFEIDYNDDPSFPEDTISISRKEFDQACQAMETAGIPLKPDRNQAWQDFAGWRVNYDTVLLALADLTMAPEAPWTGVRSQSVPGLPLLSRKRILLK
jgi:hypothetical protein